MQSYFEREPGAPSCKRGRILLVSYHFPPAQTAGALRWRKLAHFAYERGWGLDVLTLDPAEISLKDDESLGDLPPGLRIFGVPDPPIALENLERILFDAYRRLRSRRVPEASPTSMPAQAIESAEASSPRTTPASPKRATSVAREEHTFSLRAPRTWLRAYWAAIDFARSRKWARRVAQLGSQIVDSDTHRLIVSSGPPHLAHEAARLLSVRFDLPMLVDMRDAWSLNERTPEHLASPLLFSLARFYERSAVRRASLVTMNTEFARSAMQAAYPRQADRIKAIHNAYDEQPLPKVDRSGRFLIAYAGTIYLDRTPRTLFKAAGRLVRELDLEPKDFAFEFMGNIDNPDGESIEELAAREGLAGFVRTYPAAEYSVAERFMANANVLVSLPQDSHMAIPSKIFDYMRFEARLLVLAEPESATAQHLLDSDADVVLPHDVTAIFRLLKDAYQKHLAGEPVVPVARNPRFSRRETANQLFDAIDAILAPSDAA